MPEEKREEVKQWLIRPLGDLLKNVGISIAETQHVMDANSIVTQKAIEYAIEKGELTYDLKAPWYYFPEVDLELKIALSMTAKTVKDKSGKVRGYRLIPLAAPLNATYKNHFSYDVNGSSQIKAKIVSVPPSQKASE